MKIAYVVLTCDALLKDRGLKIKQTWKNLIDKEDSLYFLSSTPVPEENVLGYGDLDTYEGAPLKLMSLFKNSNFESDWVFICDDDTFVFPKRLKELLLNYDHTKEICVCQHDQNSAACKHSKFDIQFSYTYPNGGAGIAMSKLLFDSVKKFLCNYKYPKYIPYTRNSDISLGLWAKMMKFENYVNRGDVLTYFSPDDPINKNANLDVMVSMHHCNDKHFDMLYSIATKV
jgi:hypothetical protein